jgi:hypothetical protein
MNDDMLELSMWRDGNIIHENCIEDMSKLKEERDEARRMWCESEAVGNCLSVDDMKRRARAEAKRREWDCFKKENNND